MRNNDYLIFVCAEKKKAELNLNLVKNSEKCVDLTSKQLEKYRVVLINDFK